MSVFQWSEESMPHLKGYGLFKLLFGLGLTFAGALLLFVAIAAAFPRENLPKLLADKLSTVESRSVSE